jgi:anti-sigma B factor antagonist
MDRFFMIRSRVMEEYTVKANMTRAVQNGLDSPPSNDRYCYCSHMSDPNTNLEENIKNLVIRTRPHETTDELVIGLTGSVESYNAQEFETVLKKIVEQGRLRLVFDCARLDYVSSIGIGVFMNLLSSVKKKNGTVVFAAVPEAVARIFDNLGFTVFFTFREKV